MKNLLRWVTVVLMAFMVTPVWADEATPPYIGVKGEAEAMIEPDYIEWVVDIRTYDKVPKIARKVNDTIFETLLDIASKADIDTKEITSGKPAYEQRFGQGGQVKPDINRYTDTEVYRRVTLIMRDMDEFEEMLDAVHPLGVFYVVRRKSTKFDEIIQGLHVAALKDAKRKAIEQASALGQSIGKAIEVEVTRYQTFEGGLFGDPPAIEEDDAAAGPTGKINLRAYADVRFRLE